MNRETKEILNDIEAMNAINEALEDIKNGDIYEMEETNYDTLDYEEHYDGSCGGVENDCPYCLDRTEK
jgi:TnpA family transposase